MILFLFLPHNQWFTKPRRFYLINLSSVKLFLNPGSSHHLLSPAKRLLKLFLSTTVLTQFNLLSTMQVTDLSKIWIWITFCLKIYNVTPIRMAIIKQFKKTNRKEQVLARMCPAAVETVWWILKKLNIKLPHDPVINFWVCNQKKWKQELKQVSVHPCSEQHCSQYPSIHGQISGWK